MGKKVLIGTIIACMMLTGAGFAQGSRKEQAALEAAEAWLLLVDQGAYLQSYQTASSLFKRALMPETWEQSMQGVRVPLGGVMSRVVKSATYSTALPGAPDGEYVIIQYNTSFTNKKEAVETVTPMLDVDGVWRVAGYYIN